MITHYYRLKLALVPLNAAAGFLAASDVLSPVWRAIAGAVMAGGLALYALVNKVPTSAKASDEPAVSA